MSIDNAPPTPGERIAGEYGEHCGPLQPPHRAFLVSMIDAFIETQIAGLQMLIRGLSERCAAQSQLLSKRAEKTTRACEHCEGTGYVEATQCSPPNGGSCMECRGTGRREVPT